MDRREALTKILANYLRCEKCQGSISVDNIQLLGQKDDWWFFSVGCAACGESRVVAALAQDEEDLRTLEERQEAEKADKGPPISCDDVLDTHLFLRDFGGDLKSLFGGPKD